MTDEEIAVQLHVTCGYAIHETRAWVERNTDLLDIARVGGRAGLRQQLWDHAMGSPTSPLSKINGAQLSTLHRLAEQHLGWTREPLAEKVAKAVQKAMNEKARGTPLKVAT